MRLILLLAALAFIKLSAQARTRTVKPAFFDYHLQIWRTVVDEKLSNAFSWVLSRSLHLILDHDESFRLWRPFRERPITYSKFEEIDLF